MSARVCSVNPCTYLNISCSHGVLANVYDSGTSHQYIELARQRCLLQNIYKRYLIPKQAIERKKSYGESSKKDLLLLGLSSDYLNRITLPALATDVGASGVGVCGFELSNFAGTRYSSATSLHS